MVNPPWDQRIARVLVKPLVKSPVTPNQITIVSLVVALVGAGLLAEGSAAYANWGAGVFVLARFMDHFDGELARQKGMTSRLGYYLDYLSGALSYGALFICIGIGLRESALGPWAITLGLVGAASAILSMVVNLDIDKYLKADAGKDAVGYPGFAGFELEDGIYLLALITWLGFLIPFFVLAGIGSAVYCLWTCWSLFRLKRG
ncbi:MAG: CDP-alcohol phosphatidyltransferase family protein [Rhodospirillales bacterium]